MLEKHRCRHRPTVTGDVGRIDGELEKPNRVDEAGVGSTGYVGPHPKLAMNAAGGAEERAISDPARQAEGLCGMASLAVEDAQETLAQDPAAW